LNFGGNFPTFHRESAGSVLPAQGPQGSDPKRPLLYLVAWINAHEGPASATGLALPKEGGKAALTILEFLASAAFGAVFGAFVTLYNSERKIRIENVTQERAKWRDKIRSKATEISRAATGNDNAKLLELRRELSLHLNPFDPVDNDILDQIRHLVVPSADDIDTRIDAFFKNVAYLLKHDWERAKREARFWKFPCHQKESPRPVVKK
jgi:HAMP domain-containing protein